MATPLVGTRTYEYSHTLGIDDFAGRSFRYAVNLALGPEGMVYVLQRGASTQMNVSVKKCNVDEEFFGDFGSYGSEPGQMMWPAAIALDSRQRLYIADEWNQRISVFDIEGNLLDEWGEAGSEEGRLNRPSGIAFDAEENLLVVDALNHRIQKFTRDGRFLAAWGSHGSGPGQLDMPWGVAINAVGEVYVTDWRNDRVQKFTSEGKFLIAFGAAGEGNGEFNHPAGIAVDTEGDVYVVDWHNHRVQIFDPSGRFVAKLTGDATMSTWGEQLLAANPQMQEQRRTAKDLSQEKLFFGPRGIAVDGQNRIFVVDTGRGRLQIYRKVPA